MKESVQQLLSEHKAGRELALEINRVYNIIHGSITAEDQATLYKAFQLAIRLSTEAGAKL